MTGPEVPSENRHVAKKRGIHFSARRVKENEKKHNTKPDHPIVVARLLFLDWPRRERDLVLKQHQTGRVEVGNNHGESNVDSCDRGASSSRLARRIKCQGSSWREGEKKPQA